MKKILTVIGARPQFIKAAMVSRLLKNCANIKEVIVHTGQHYDANMSEVFFTEMEIPRPDYELEIGSASHGKQTGNMLVALEKVLQKENPALVLIYGDTNSTLAGALSAAKLHIPVAHVEAGLRSFNKKMPEEINRIVADQLSALLFVPTEQGIINLKQEGFSDDKIFLTGDVMFDAAIYYGAKADKFSTILQQLNLTSKNYILTTIHRAENTNDLQRLVAIFTALKTIAEKMPVVLPLHPRTLHILQQQNLLAPLTNNLKLIEPVGYLDMVMLEKNASLIATDSGGVQKEAFFYHVPCVTLRDETEWVELVELMWNRVVPPVSATDIVKNIQSALLISGDKKIKPYGNGDAGQCMVDIIQTYVNT